MEVIVYFAVWEVDQPLTKIGFMTFSPEWLSGSANLNTSNFMYMWVYLFFFNMLWVVFPLWVLYEAHGSISLAFARASGAIGAGAKKIR